MADNALIKNGVEIFDGQFILKLSKDRMKAFILPRDDAMNDVEVNKDRLKVELEGQGVVYGILDNPEPLQKGGFCVAKGKPPEHGVDATVKMHVKPSVVRDPKMKDPEKDQVDYRELGNIVNVKSDKLLLEKILATKELAEYLRSKKYIFSLVHYAPQAEYFHTPIKISSFWVGGI